jgi:MFS family permease
MSTLTATPPRLLTAATVRLLVLDFAAMSCFYLLLPVVPLYATDRGIGTAGAGLSTGLLLFAAVSAELAAPGLAARLGFRRLLVAGLVLLGAPALALPAVGSLTGLLLVAGLRGAGFAVVVVAVGALAATVLPAERRGEGLGVLGLVATVPAVVMLPLGVWLAAAAGFPAVFAAGAVLAVAPVLLVPGLPAPVGGRSAGLALPPAVLRPVVVFAATAVAGGVVVAFLPAAVPAGLAAPALFAQSLAATVARWLAGGWADRHGGAHLLAPAVVLCALGMAAAALTGSGPAVVAGMAAFGAGFGLAQAASLTVMLQRVDPDRYAAVSAAWNAAYDLGWGVGAVGIGVVASTLGYPAAFLAGAVVALAALPLAAARR